MRKALMITQNGIKIRPSYYLPDMSYGQFLIYNQFKPAYYVDFFDSRYQEIRKQVETDRISAKALLRKLLATDKQYQLALSERCLWKFRFGKEISVLCELEPYEINSQHAD